MLIGHGVARNLRGCKSKAKRGGRWLLPSPNQCMTQEEAPGDLSGAYLPTWCDREVGGDWEDAVCVVIWRGRCSGC